MKKAEKWRRLLALILTVVMMTQNIQVLNAGTTTAELDARTGASAVETQASGPSRDQIDTRVEGGQYEEQEDAQIADLYTDGTNVAMSDSADVQQSPLDVTSNIKQEVYQQEIDGYTYNFVQMTARVTNNDTEHDAVGVDVKVLLPEQLSYVTVNETPQMSGFNNPSEAAAYGFALSEVPADILGRYTGQVIMWTNQVIGAGQSAAYTFTTQLQNDITDVSGVNPAWYIGGAAQSYTWVNTEVLAPVEEMPEEPEVTETPEESEVTETLEEPEVTESPEEPSEPEVTETPEEPSEPEVTETPEEPSEPEVTETPEEPTEPEVIETPEEPSEPEITESPEESEITETPKEPETTETPAPEKDKEKAAFQKKINRLISQRAAFAMDEEVEFSSGVDGDAPVARETSGNLADFIYNAQIKPDDGMGTDGKPTADNGSCKISISFSEDPADNGRQFEKTLTYTLPEGITVYKIEGGVIEGRGALNGADLGTYTITPPTTPGGQATMTVTFYDVINNEPFESYKNLDCTIEFESWFNVNAGETGEDKTFVFSDGVDVTITFEQGNRFSGRKSASTYIRGDGSHPGYFEFTIEVQSDEDLAEGESFTIEDILGNNLSLYGEIECDNSNVKFNEKTNKSGFDATVNGPLNANTPIIIKYKAEIKDITESDNNGNVTNIGNTAVIDKGKTDEVTLEANPSYKPGQVAEKSNDGIGLDDGKVLWTITVNPNGDHNMSGKEIKDKLLDEGMTYDTTTPITSTPSLAGLTWAAILNAQKDGWSYKLPDDAGYQTYVIQYKTIVPGSSEDKQYSNTVSIDSETVGSSTVEIPGTGSGSGSGSGLEKIYENEDVINGEKYVWWKSIIRIPENGAENVVYRDELTGSHELEDPFSLDAGNINITDKDGESVIGADISRTDNKSFTVGFGSVEGPQEYTISYRTKVMDNGTVHNIGYLESNGKTTSSPAKHTVQDYTFSKSGVVTNKEQGIITWKVVLNDGTFNLGAKKITVIDTFSGNLSYVSNSAKVTMNGDNYVSEEDGDFVVTVNGNTIVVPVGKIPGQSKYILEYQTKLNSSVSIGDVNTFKNKATIKDETGKMLGEPTSSVTISNKVLSKKLLDRATSENSYVASYEVLLNEDRQFFDATVGTFEINDVMSSNQVLDRETVKLERQIGINGGWTEVPESELTTTEISDHSIHLVVTTESGNINRVVYRLTYKARVQKTPDSSETVPDKYDNDITYTVKGNTYTDDTEDEVDWSQGSGGSGDGSVLKYTVVKSEVGTQNRLEGAKFALYKVDANNDIITPAILNNMVTDKDGKLTFGAATGVMYKCDLSSNQKYMLREIEAPSGYCKAADYYFYVDGTNLDGVNGLPNGSNIYIDDSKAVQVKAKKIWDVPSGMTTPEVKFTLYSKYENENANQYKPVEGAEVKTISGNVLEAVWNNLPYSEFHNNALQKIDYTVREAFTVPTESGNYSQQVSASFWDEETKTYTICVTNASTEHTISKVWDDNENEYGNRPTEITVQLKRNDANYGATVIIVPDTSGNWTYTWTDLPKYDNNGNEYKYTAVENTVPNYAAEYVESTDGLTTTITNKPNTDTTSHTIRKIWNDGNNADGVRPDKVTVQLYNGADKYDDQVEITPDAKGDWEYTWRDLPLIVKGKPAVYTAQEVTVPDGYEKTEETAETTTTVTNTHEFEKVAKTVRKVWTGENEAEDNNAQPVEVKLIAKAVIDNETVSAAGDRSVTLNTENNWTYRWENLPKKYKGAEITYSVEEVTNLTGFGYVAQISEDAAGIFTVTNTYTREETERTVKKVWDDSDNQDGVRPETIKVILTGMVGNEEVYSDTQELSGTANVDGKMKLEHKWEKLPVYVKGQEVVYKITETLSNGDPISTIGYTATETADNTGKIITFTNKKNKEETEIVAKKIWEDNNNQDGKRPVNVTLQLYEQKANNDGTYGKATPKGDAVTFTGAGDEWTYTWKELDKKANGYDIKYTVQETIVPAEYVVSYDNSGLEVTNTYIPKTTKIVAHKVWNDNNNQDGLRKQITEIKVTLQKAVYELNGYSAFSNVTFKDAQTAEQILKEETEIQSAWSKMWDNLPIYENGHPVHYRVIEEISYEDGKSGYVVSYHASSDSASNADYITAIGTDHTELDKAEVYIKNSYTPETVNITATKAWNDGNDRDGLRKDITSITFTLYSKKTSEQGWTEGEKITFIQADNPGLENLSHSWSNLPKYKDGELLHYKVEESIQWNNNDSAAKYDAPQYSSPDLTESGTITVTNTHIPATVPLTVEKIWNDAFNTDNYRPESLTVKLWKETTDGEGNVSTTAVSTFPDVGTTDTITLNAENSWTGGWDKLYKYENGEEIKYTVTEAEFANDDKYTIKETEKAENSFAYTLTNGHETEKTSLYVIKNWDDGNNIDNLRPKEIEVVLKADDVQVGEAVTLNEANAWSYEWKDLPVNKERKSETDEFHRIVYTVEETSEFSQGTYEVTYGYSKAAETAADTGASSSVNPKEESWQTCVITNTHKTDKTRVLVLKYWMDDNYKGRPEEVTFALWNQTYNKEAKAYNDSVKVEGSEKTIKGTVAQNMWMQSWENLPRKVNQEDTEEEEIIYSVKEENIPEGYTMILSGEKNIYTATNIRTSVELRKTDASGKEELPGAKMELYRKSDSVRIDSWTSTETAHVMNNLVPGETYILKETTAPDGYTLAEEIEFTVGMDGKCQTVTMKDEPTKVAVSKKTLTGEEETMLAGAHLQILNSDKEVFDDWISTGSEKIIEKLPAGSYTLHEEKAPAGYYPAEDIDFVLTENGEVKVDNKAVSGITMRDYPVKLVISKKAATGEEELPGADLELYKVTKVQPEEPETPETPAESKEELTLVDSWTSGTTPHIITAHSLGSIEIGDTYVLREVKAPDGYSYAAEVRFIVEKDGVEVADHAQLVTMRDYKNEITISKKALTGGTELLGAELQIIKGETVIEEWVSDGTPHPVTATLVAGETYILHEKKAPAGYLLADDMEFTVGRDGNVTIVVGENEEVPEPSKTVTMYDTLRIVKVLKKDKDSNVLAGAELQIVDEDDKVIEDTWTSDTEAHTVSAKLEVGKKYYLKEVKAPAGYTIADKVEFTVDATTEVIEVTMLDTPTTLTISKKSITGTASLGGAELRVVDKDGKVVVEKWTTEAGKDKVVTGELSVGVQYYLEEVKAPNGYAKADSIPFTLNDKGEVIVNEKAETMLIMRDAKLRIKVIKTDKNDDEGLEGAILQIFAKADTERKTPLAEWTTDGKPHYVDGVEAHLVVDETYVLHEKLAPEGYAYADDVEFTIKEDSIEGTEQLVTMSDEKNAVFISKKDITGTKELPGAKLELRDLNGKVLESWTSTSEEYKITTKLEAGKEYVIHEVTAPDGYTLAEDVKFTVNKDGRPTHAEMKDAPTKVEILKVDEKGKGLSGATLVVKDYKGKEIDRWVSDGNAHVIEGILIENAEYTLSEVDAPQGYTLAKDITFTVKGKEVIKVTMENLPNKGKGKITVTKKVSLLEGLDIFDITAKDDTFYVNIFTDKEGTHPYGGFAPKAIHLVNASSGSVTFDNLPDGTYYVFETDAAGSPLTYGELNVLNGKEFVCNAENDVTSATIDLKAGDKEGYVNLENVFYEFPDGYYYDAYIDISKKVLKGTSETTVKDTFYAGIFTKDEDGIYNLFTVVTLVQNDTVRVKVPLGGENGDQPIKYYILETDEEGTIVDLDVFEYEVSGEGTVSLSKENALGEINIVNKLPEDKKGKLLIQKVDGGGIGLAGAAFRITDADGNVVKEWTSAVSAQEVILEPGKYTLTELKAPEGYTGAGSLTIIAASDGTFTVNGSGVEFSYNSDVLKYVNRPVKKPETPGTGGGGGNSPSSPNYINTLGKGVVKTGDDTPIELYVLLLAAAVLALTGTVFARKRRNKK